MSIRKKDTTEYPKGTRWNVYDRDDNWIGLVNASTEGFAIKWAQALSWPVATVSRWKEGDPESTSSDFDPEAA